LTTLCIALLAVPGAAMATSTVPPGVSGAAQYTESLPGAGGEESTKSVVEADKGGGGKATGPAQTLGTENAEKLEALGPEGKAAAGLAAAGRGGDGGNGSGDKDGSEGTGGAAAGTATRSSGGGSGVGQVVGQLSGSEGSSGMGLLLPLLIAMAVVAAAGYLIGRRRVIAHDQP
jgi:hypothetical protein